jgi:antitoxin (DNA-binding transcriptional repressor) of toxin-antitoxin stability system
MEDSVRIALTEARRQLPSLLKRLRSDPRERIEITVRGEPIAELRAVVREPKPGEAARRLLALGRKFARVKGQGHSDVSSHVKGHLYGPRGVLR